MSRPGRASAGGAGAPTATTDRCPAAPTNCCAEQLGDGGPRVEPVALERVVAARGVAAARRASPPWPPSSATAYVTPRPRPARLARRGPQLPGPRPAARAAGSRSRPTPCVFPADSAEVAARPRGLRRARRRRRALRWRHERRRRRRGAARRIAPGAICLDLARLDALVSVDAESQLATFGAGTSTGPTPSACSAEHGLTLGHFPQSFEFSTVGGWVATRSAGQASTGYGRIDELVQAVRVATPARRDRDQRRAGDRRRARPARAARRLGGHARRHHRGDAARPARPREAPLRGVGDPRLRGGRRGAARARAGRARRGRHPPVRRGGDAASTSRWPAAGPRRSGRYLAVRAVVERPCLLILSLRRRCRTRSATGAGALRASCAATARVTLGAAGGRGVGEGPLPRALPARRAADRRRISSTRSRPRRRGPTRWRPTAAVGVRAARRAGRARHARRWSAATSPTSTPPAARSTSPSSRARSRDRPLEQWQAAKSAAGDAIAAAGATITHHHAVGPRPRAVARRARSANWASSCCAPPRTALDPTGIMNPGKLLP